MRKERFLFPLLFLVVKEEQEQRTYVSGVIFSTREQRTHLINLWRFPFSGISCCLRFLESRESYAAYKVCVSSDAIVLVAMEAGVHRVHPPSCRSRCTSDVLVANLTNVKLCNAWSLYQYEYWSRLHYRRSTADNEFYVTGTWFTRLSGSHVLMATTMRLTLVR